MLASQVDGHKGMKQKYPQLLEWLTSDPYAKIVKVTRNHIYISCIMHTTASYLSINETFGVVEIYWNAHFGNMGHHKMRWNFPSTTNEIAIIEKIGTDLEEYKNRIF